ncbi:MAG: hypothetical protein AB7O97_07510 [Planctomycetota bacterium]
MDTPERRGEAVLADWIAGVRGDADPEVLALLAERPELREQVERMRALASALDDAGGRSWRSAATAQPSPFDDAARRLVTERLAARRPRRAAAWLAAAALLVGGVGGGLWWSRGPDAADERSTLGLADRDLSPKGAVAAYMEFAWRLSRAPDCTYRVRFRAAEAGGGILYESGPLTESPWVADDEARAAFRDRMTWEVDVVDAAGQVVDGIGPVTVHLEH